MRKNAQGKRNKWKTANTHAAALFRALTLSAALCAAASGAVYAMPPYDHIPEGCSEETWNRMQDDLIEWDEIGDLVQYYNPAYTQAFDSANGSITDLSGAYATFVRDMQNTLETTDETMKGLEESQKALSKLPEGSKVPSSDGTLISRDEALLQLQAGLSDAKRGRSKIAKVIRDTADSITKASQRIERELQPVKKQLTQAMQGMVITYEQVAINRTMVEKQIALYQTAYDTQLRMQAQGLATDFDVLSAKNELLSAQASLAKLDSNLELLRRNLGLQLGWDGNTLPRIGDIPEPDAAFVDTTNPDADKTAAVMHNKEVRDAGKVQYSDSTGFSLRDRTENEKIGLLTAKMDSLYADMKQKKALYETAQTTLKKAELTKNAAEKKYQLGMLGRAEYEGQQLAYTSYEASYQLAKLSLFQAINTYQWAVDGYVTLD